MYLEGGAIVWQEPPGCVVWCYLQVHNARTELNPVAPAANHWGTACLTCGENLTHVYLLIETVCFVCCRERSSRKTKEKHVGAGFAPGPHVMAEQYEYVVICGKIELGSGEKHFCFLTIGFSDFSRSEKHFYCCFSFCVLLGGLYFNDFSLSLRISYVHTREYDHIHPYFPPRHLLYPPQQSVYVHSNSILNIKRANW